MWTDPGLRQDIRWLSHPESVRISVRTTMSLRMAYSKVICVIFLEEPGGDVFPEVFARGTEELPQV